MSTLLLDAMVEDPSVSVSAGKQYMDSLSQNGYGYIYIYIYMHMHTFMDSVGTARIQEPEGRVTAYAYAVNEPWHIPLQDVYAVIRRRLKFRDACAVS